MNSYIFMGNSYLFFNDTNNIAMLWKSLFNGIIEIMKKADQNFDVLTRVNYKQNFILNLILIKIIDIYVCYFIPKKMLLSNCNKLCLSFTNNITDKI
jgi:hypothetical protein